MKQMKLMWIGCLAFLLAVTAMIEASPSRLSPLWVAVALVQDQFGYQFQEQDYQWLEAPGGTSALEFSSADDGYVSVSLPFSFPFYENRYNEVFVSTNGLITFGAKSTSFNNQPIPHLAPPHNFVAVFWDDLAVGGSYNSGKVTAFQIGEKFVIEWKEVSRAGDTQNRLTLEAILSSDGTICLQYQNLAGDLTSATIGIEDGDGVDGLQILYNSSSSDLEAWVASKAVCFIRPTAAGRVKLLPPYQSTFTHNRQADFLVQIKNTGELGKDRYNLTVQQQAAVPWNVEIFEENAQTRLTDGDGDGKPDLEVPQGEIRKIFVRATAANAKSGNYARIELKATSKNTSSHTATAILQPVVPARFVQFLADDRRGLNIQWITESTRRETSIEENFTGSAMAMGKGLAGLYPLVWEVNGRGYAALSYRWLSGRGDPLFETRSIEAHAEGSLIFDREPSLAQLADGTVAVVWVRNETKEEGNSSNVYFLRLDSQGKALDSPLNVTKQLPAGVSEMIAYSAPRLVALQNPAGWLLVWQAARQGKSEIHWARLNLDGTIAEAAQPLLAADDRQYRLPSLLEVRGNQTWLFCTETVSASVVNTLKGWPFDTGTGTLSNPINVGQGWQADSVQMDSGNVVVAWTGENGQTWARLLKSQNFQLANDSIELPVPYERRRTENVSLAYASADTMVATWKDADEEDFLYYALLQEDEGEPSGLKVLTPPMIMYTAEGGLKVLISAAGQGNAPYPPAQLFLPLILRQ